MPNKATLYSIYALADMIDERPFDTSVFPFQVSEGVTVEDVTPMFNPDTFAWVRNELGRRDVEDLQRVDYAIAHRYAANDAGDGGNALRALTARPSPVVIAGTPSAEALMPALRRRPELASTHVVVAAALDSPDARQNVHSSCL